MCDTIGLKIPKGTPLAKFVKIIRKIDSSLSISDISARINNDEYVLTYDYTDSDGVKTIISCYEQLTELGIKPVLFELDDEECDIETLRNLDNMYDEISEEVEAEIDAEVDAEDDGEE